MKIKICSFCNKEVPKLWKSNPKTCFNCRNKGKELNSKTLSSEKDTGSPVKKRKPIKPISDKMAGRLKEYRLLRDKYLKDHPECARCGTTRNQTLQHLQGREGDLLTDVNNFMTLCVPCHQWATEFTNDAIEQGFARSRNKKSGN